MVQTPGHGPHHAKLKLVVGGPEGADRRSFLARARAASERAGELTTIDTEGDTTHFVDLYWPWRDRTVQLQLFCLDTPCRHVLSKQLLLQGAGGILFLAESGDPAANLAELQGLLELQASQEEARPLLESTLVLWQGAPDAVCAELRELGLSEQAVLREELSEHEALRLLLERAIAALRRDHERGQLQDRYAQLTAQRLFEPAAPGPPEREGLLSRLLRWLRG